MKVPHLNFDFSTLAPSNLRNRYVEDFLATPFIKSGPQTNYPLRLII